MLRKLKKQMRQSKDLFFRPKPKILGIKSTSGNFPYFFYLKTIAGRNTHIP